MGGSSPFRPAQWWSASGVKLGGQLKPSFHWPGTRTWEVQHYCGNDRGCRDPAECREWHLRLFPVSRYNWSVSSLRAAAAVRPIVRCVPSHREGRPLGGPTFTSTRGNTGLRWQVIGWDMKYEVHLNGHIESHSNMISDEVIIFDTSMLQITNNTIKMFPEMYFISH